MARGSKTVSQTQLAKELGISQALVSLILNGRRQGISPSTYNRVWDHALRRGYHPKGMRVDSRTPSLLARQVAVVLGHSLRLHTLGHHLGQVLEGLHAALLRDGLTVTYLGPDDALGDGKLEQLLPDVGAGFRGIATLGPVSRGCLTSLRRQETPVVSLYASFPDLCHSVLGDEIESLRHAVKHLHLNGHRRIGWLGHSHNGDHDDTLLEPLRLELKASGLSLDSRYVVIQAHDDRAAGAEAIFALVDHQRRRDFPTAFLCRNCLMASGAMAALKRERWSVPQDVSIVGADHPGSNGKEASHITGAGPDPLRVGAAAAQLLVNPMRQPEPNPSSNGQGTLHDTLISSNGHSKDAPIANDRSGYVDVVVPAELVVGSSSGPAPM